MSRSDYFESLKDPRWQRKRLEIFQRDEFACVHCGDVETTLHVHHLAYWPGVEPWEYPDEWLRTLCANCHEERTELDREDRQENGSFHRQVFSFISTMDPNAALDLLIAVWRAAKDKEIPQSRMARHIVALCRQDKKTHRLSDWIKEVDESGGRGDR